MILLTIYREAAGKKERREFARIQEAIEFGQRTGSDYEIYDPVTGRVIDYNEINVQEEPEWYYDERECLWKRYCGRDETDETPARGDARFRMFGQTRNLRRVGS